LNRTDEIFLLEKLKEGDVQALEVIFNRYYANLCKYLSLLFKNKVVVEHIAQDIFVYLWENRESLVIRESLETYIYTAGRFKAINQIRNKKNQDSILKSLEEHVSDHLAVYDNKLETEELQAIIEEAIAFLPERCQKIFRLSREEELTYKEIGILLSISTNTVEGQMTIALKKLRKQLRPFYLQILLAI
jgi:RNA polymerase sigma-70 factor (ECF subfamily)